MHPEILITQGGFSLANLQVGLGGLFQCLSSSVLCVFVLCGECGCENGEGVLSVFDEVSWCGSFTRKKLFNLCITLIISHG